MSLLSKIQELLSIWFPNKTQDQTNYNNWMDAFIGTDNGNLIIFPITDSDEKTIDTTMQSLCTLSYDFIITFDYYPTNTWEWFYFYIGSSVIVLSSSYDKGSNFGLTSLGYNKWISVEIKYINGTVTASSGTQTQTQSINVTYPVEIKYYGNKTGTKIRNVERRVL